MTFDPYMYFCCECEDGPKIYNIQPTCVNCNHKACSNCRADVGFRGPVGVLLGQAPYIAPELFVGRVRELNEIAEIIPKNQTLVLGGISGVGKTQLALAHARSRSRYYSSVLWLNAASEATLNDSFRSIYKIIYNCHDDKDIGSIEEKVIIKRVLQWLSDRNNKRWLLIFDSYDQPSHFDINSFYPPGSNGSIIVTSRSPSLVARSAFHMQIKPFHRIADGLAMLQARSKRKNLQSDPHAERLVKILNGIPLALATAGIYIQRNALTFENYLEEYEKLWKSDPRQYHLLREYSNRPVQTALDLSTGRMEKLDLQEGLERHPMYKSNPPSIFSLQSIQSTVRTTDTLLTADEICTALDELVGIFVDDKQMALLYREAVFEKRIAPLRFVHNFRHLLKRFAVQLKEEAQEAIHVNLANFVASRAGLIAAKIGSKYEQQYFPETTSAQSPGNQVGNEAHVYLNPDSREVSSEDEDESEPERAFDEKFSALVSQGRSFIKESIAFQKLQEDLKNSVIPPKLNRGSSAWRSFELPLLFQRCIRYVSSKTLGWELKDQALRWAIEAHLISKRILSRVDLLEDSVPEKHQRFRWTSRRGKDLFDDYVEHEPGALQALREYLSATTVPIKDTSARNEDRDTSHAPFIYTLSPIPTFTGAHTSVDITEQSTNIPNSPQTGISQQDIEIGSSSSCPLLLLSCIEKRGSPVRLHQELVTHVADDRELFHVLRRIYHSHRKNFESFWSLRSLHSIHFMKFGYGGHGLIDVRCHPEPCERGQSCACIPPAHLVSPQGGDYVCQPIPSKLSPPCGPQLMMDLFKDPDSRKPHADFILRQLPKKVGTDLDLNEAEMMEAWGIFYREDWDWMRIWIVLGVAFFPPSLLFGILWGIMKQDIQGAFGVASWWMTSATIALGIVGTCT